MTHHPLIPSPSGAQRRRALPSLIASWYERQLASRQRLRDQSHPLCWEADRLVHEALNAADGATLQAQPAVDFEELASRRLAEVLDEQGSSAELRSYAGGRLDIGLARRREGIALAQFVPGEDIGHIHRVKIVTKGKEIGILGYRVCAKCQVGQLAKLSIWSPYRRGGLGRKALYYLMDRYPGVRWVTSGQYPQARGFWKRMGDESGAGWAEGSMPCDHVRD